MFFLCLLTSKCPAEAGRRVRQHEFASIKNRKVKQAAPEAANVLRKQDAECDNEKQAVPEAANVLRKQDAECDNEKQAGSIYEFTVYLWSLRGG